jgi:hypothetical protein
MRARAFLFGIAFTLISIFLPFARAQQTEKVPSVARTSQSSLNQGKEIPIAFPISRVSSSGSM